jgi:hypothetical protein
VSWRLSPRLLNEILEHLYEELADNPHKHLSAVAGWDSLVYSFSVRAEGDKPRDYLFEFYVRYHPDEMTLLIGGGDFTSVEAGS